jgi:hypothetical protein
VIWTTEGQAQLLDLAIDMIGNGATPSRAIEAACGQLRYSWLTVNAVRQLENFALGSAPEHATIEQQVDRLKSFATTSTRTPTYEEVSAVGWR